MEDVPQRAEFDRPRAVVALEPSRRCKKGVLVFVGVTSVPGGTCISQSSRGFGDAGRRCASAAANPHPPLQRRVHRGAGRRSFGPGLSPGVDPGSIGHSRLSACVPFKTAGPVRAEFRSLHGERQDCPYKQPCRTPVLSMVKSSGEPAHLGAVRRRRVDLVAVFAVDEALGLAYQPRTSSCSVSAPWRRS